MIKKCASDCELDNIAPDKEVFEISEMLLEKNKEAYEELAK